MNERLIGIPKSIFSGIYRWFKNDSVVHLTRNPSLYSQFSFVFQTILPYFGRKVHQWPRIPSEHSFSNLMMHFASAVKCQFDKANLPSFWWFDNYGPMLAKTKAGEPCALLPSRSGYLLMTLANPKGEVLTREKIKKLEEIYALYPLMPEVVGWKELLKFIFEGIKKPLLLWFGFLILMNALGYVVPWLMSLLFDLAVPLASFAILWQILLGLFLIEVMVLLLDIAQSSFFIRLRLSQDLLIQYGLWERLVRLPLTFFQKYSVGDLENRAMGIDHIQHALTASVSQIIMGGALSIFNLIIIMVINFKFGLVLFGLALLMVIAMVINSRIQYHYQRKILDNEGKTTGRLFEWLKSIKKIRSSHAEENVFEHWAELFCEKIYLFQRSRLITIRFMSFEFIFPILTTVLLCNFFLDAQPPLSLGHFIMIFSLTGMFWGSLIMLARAGVGNLRILPTYNRLKPLLTEQPELTLDPLTSSPVWSGALRVENLKFRYKEEGSMILDSISLNIKPGQFVAIVGPSGAGKSTLMRILLGLEPNFQGDIFYDDQVARGLNTHGLRQQIGAVLQSTTLHGGTLLENIMGFEGGDEKKAWKAAEMAQLKKDIEALPMGMHTFVDEEGNTFSHGQRQRILIARALVREPKVLLFDEATSALDNRTQEATQQTIQNLHMTRILIAHRLSTIQKADWIYVLDKGRLVQEGTYEDLIKQEGLFKAMAERQY